MVSLTKGVKNGKGRILFFTSGTTSRRKAVVLTEQSLCASVYNCGCLLPLEPELPSVPVPELPSVLPPEPVLLLEPLLPVLPVQKEHRPLLPLLLRMSVRLR